MRPLKSRFPQLNQERNQIQEKVRAIANYARKKELEATNLTNEKSQVDLQKAKIQKSYRLLYENYQQSQSEIAKLKKMIEDTSKENYSRFQIVVPPTIRDSIKRVSKKDQLTETEWNEISNQDDYYRVSGYLRNNGTWVEPYYRRMPRKRRSS